MNRTSKRSLAVAALAGCVLGGCATPADVALLRDRADELHGVSQEQARRVETLLAALPEEDPRRAEGEALLAAARARAALAHAATAQLDAVLQETDPESPASAVVESLAPWIPGPAQLPLLLGAGLVAALARAAQLKRGLASVARSIEVAAREDETLRERLRAGANTLRSIQTASARRVVDEVTKPGRRPAVSLPV